MSSNNQTLIAEHKGKYLVFSNVMAESWIDEDGKENELLATEAIGTFDTLEEAYKVAHSKGWTEYGIGFNKLLKDEASVKII